MNGILAIDKPKGWTSHDVVAKVRHLSGLRRIGHAGTLDPLATGVLLLCLGEATRMSDLLMGGTKWYVARVALGVSTTTDDAEGEVLRSAPVRHTLSELYAALGRQVGVLQQTPPSFAAIKQGGVPAYRQARAGTPVELASRPVTVYALTVLADHASDIAPIRTGEAAASTNALVDVLICCSKGTYIRSIARDVGETLGCGAHLAGLRRLASGTFTTRDCVSMEELAAEVADVGPTAVRRRLMPLDTAATHLPACVLGDRLAENVRYGREIPGPIPQDGSATSDMRVYASSGAFLALAVPLEDHKSEMPQRLSPTGRWRPRQVYGTQEVS